MEEVWTMKEAETGDQGGVARGLLSTYVRHRYLHSKITIMV